MTSLKKILRPMILSTLFFMTGAVGDARGCDGDCPWDGAGSYTTCWESDLGPGQCWYSDMHYYWTSAGC